MKKPSLIPLSRPSISNADIAAVSAVLRSGWLTMGPVAAEFENKLSQSVGRRPVLAVSSGTAALHLALTLAGVGKNDEVITTPMTFAATANVILMTGARPIFADIDPETWNIDPAKIEQAITERTKVIMPVHFAGRPCDMEKINSIAARHKLKVIEDAAQAFGASYQGKSIGSGENFVCFSFHPMKEITTIEGGALVLPGADLLPLAKRIRFHGIEKDAWKTFKGVQTDIPYDVSVLGYKYNMSDVSAALGLSQLKRERSFFKKRGEIARAYIAALKSVEGITVPMKDSAQPPSSWNLFHILLDDGISRRDFMAALKQNGVASGIYYRALHQTTLYKNLLGDLDGKFPNAERFSGQATAIPIFPEMTENEIDTVVNAVKKALRRVKESCVSK
ncbi:MAG: DegT/DnrJ/EryC1/StrS aminotransferase family protein [Candidatus Omnitrophica bacterium]|nr:DegT/DnrJ/EryC1/StrS aminotransferase family protein [Candidatus Omnitrophota bacterium]